MMKSKTHVVKTEDGIFTADIFCDNCADEVIECLSVIESLKEKMLEKAKGDPVR